MIGIVIVTHGQLGQEFISVLYHITGPQEALGFVSIAPDDETETCLTRIKEEVGKVDQGNGVLIVTDLFGGTPSNLAISLIEPNKIEVMAGVNMPALVKLITVRKDKPLNEATKIALEAGKKYMVLPSEFL